MGYGMLLKVFVALDFILSVSCGIFLIIMLNLFATDSTWNTYPEFFIEPFFFFVLAFIVFLSQTVYLYALIKNSPIKNFFWLKITLLIANLSLIALICNYGIAEIMLEVSFTGTWWHLNILKRIAIFSFFLSFMLANALIIFNLFRRESNDGDCSTN